MPGGREREEQIPRALAPDEAGESLQTDPMLKVRTLGHVAIRWRGREIGGTGLRKNDALLLYLAVNPGQHGRSRLAGLLWGGLPEDRARSNLRHALWSLRRDLDAAAITSDRLSIGISPDLPCQVDARTFEVALEDAARARRQGAAPAAVRHLETAVALYRGDFLTRFDLTDCLEFEEWAMRRRVSLRECALKALTTLVTHHTRQASYDKALNYARQLLSLDPWREEAHRDVMRLLALTGQRSAALAQFETCRQLLETELGLEPLEETMALYHRLLQWDSDRFSRTGHGQSADLIIRLPFTGRGEEQGSLVDWWRASHHGGRQRLALIEGEAGVGKTRLVEEVTRYLRAEGAMVLRGQCYEFGSAVPYQPIAEALRGYMSAMGDERRRGGEKQIGQEEISPAPLPPRSLAPVWLSELSRLLPEIRQARPNLPEPVYVSGEAARQRLFEAVARFLFHQDAGSLLLFLDDLQWADRSTLDLLHYLVRQTGREAISIIGTYRPEEVDLSHPVTRLRQTLGRDGVVDRLVLEPLSAGAVEDIARSLVGDEEGMALGGFLYRESEGNPFILTEVVNMLEEEGALGRIPGGTGPWGWYGWSGPQIVSTGVRDIVLQRVGRLSDVAQRLLSLASIVGRRFSVPLLELAAGRDAGAVEQSVDEWMSRRLVCSRSDSGRPARSPLARLDFSHDKIRAVVYDTVALSRRRMLHRRVAEALEQGDGAMEEDRDQLLAHHWDQAAQPHKAAAYHLRAGDQARLVYAHREAVDHYQQALAALKEQGAQERAARTLMKLGLTYHNALDFRRAREAYDEGFALWQDVRAVRSVTTTSLMAEPTRGQVLRVRWVEPTSLDPGLVSDGDSGCLLAHLFSGLVALSPELDVVPDVARAWEMSDGGRRFVFHLRDDVSWGDGTPVRATDFEYAWKRVLDPATRSPAAGFLQDLKGARAFKRGQGTSDNVAVRAHDEATLAVELEAPVGYFLQLLTHAAYSPVPRHAVEAYGNGWAEPQAILSNGPFKLKAWRRGAELILSRNPTYHGRFSGNLERVEVFPVMDWSARLAKYGAGELSVLGISYFPAGEREEARQRHAEEYISGPRLETSYLALNASCPPFDDVRVRRALAMATDRETLADVVLKGYVSPATGGLVPPSMPGHSQDIGLPYDPEGARRLLAEAGYPDGKGFPTVEAVIFDAVAARGDYLRAQWCRVLGLEVAWEVLPWGQFLQRLTGEPPHILALMWAADYPDPDSFLRVCRERTWSRWRNEAYERLVGEARRSTDLTERIERYREADRLLVEEVPILPLTYERTHLLVKPWVSQYPTSAMQAAFWKDVVIEPHHPLPLD